MSALAEAKLAAIAKQVEEALWKTPVFDVHTHLYDPAFGSLLLWGIDDLLTYHYLLAETLRYVRAPYDDFWKLAKTEQADLIWSELFVKHSPVSEACQGVVTTLNQLGLDPRRSDLAAIRHWFTQFSAEQYVDRCFELGGVRQACMTNSPFDDTERPVWEKIFPRHPRFAAALRIDPLLLAWPEASATLAGWGYSVGNDLTAGTISEIRSFLADWTGRIEARYLMVSLPPDFEFPARNDCALLLDRALLPHCREFGVPLALMLGVKRGVNRSLALAGDGSGAMSLDSLAHLCAAYPDNKFLVTVLARENQHELCVLARKFRNLHVFGCWWFMNIPYLVEEITRFRLELLGLSFTPQHSDARVLDQLIYKWNHSRRILQSVLTQKYAQLARAGWEVTPQEIERDARYLLGGAFEEFCGTTANKRE